MKLAVGMFVDTYFDVKESFVEKSRKYLKSSIEKLNFHTDPEKQRDFINNWVLNKTNNKIKNLFPKSIYLYIIIISIIELKYVYRNN